MNGEQCLYPNCKKGVYSRGLCANHYQTALHIIRQKKGAWSQFEANGKSLPLKTGRVTQAVDWFMDGKASATHKSGKS